MKWSRLLAVTAASLSALRAFAAPTDAPPRVAVFSQTGFPTYNVSSAISPKGIAANLTASGIPADALDADALSDPARFKSRDYAAVILPYGNAYPEAAFDNLKAFHRAGGCLILSAIPFTHAVRRMPDGNWRDMGHDGDPALFGSSGIGVGGFAGGSSGPIAVAKGDPLGLKALRLDWGDGERVQRLDPKSLPESAKIIPLQAAKGVPISCMIVHGNDDFNGAVDVWTTNDLENDEDLMAYGEEQLLERGTVAALIQKGSLSDPAKLKAFASLDKIPRPDAFANIKLPVLPRPYPTLQPKRPAPARHLYVSDARHLDYDQRVLITSLQGIVNRSQPRIYLVWNDEDQFWLDEMIGRKQTDEPIKVDDPLSLIGTFRSAIKGAVTADPKVYVSPLIAVDIAGIEDYVIASPELARQYDIPIKSDLRGQFKDDADAYRYARTVLLPRMNPYLATCLDPPILGSQIDDIIAAKGMAFWVTGPKQQDKPGANETEERREIQRTFSAMPLNAVIRGFWWHGEGQGLDEGPGVTLGSRFGKITTVSDYVANYSVLSGVEVPSLKRKPQPPAPKLDRSKVYLAITVSDGDNLCTWRGHFRDQFLDPLHGAFPIAWGMGPTLLDIAPTMAQWYYDHASPTDEIICDVSGVGYISCSDWGAALKGRDAAYKSFYDWTQKYMARMDMKTMREMHPDEKDIARAGKDMPKVAFLMPDYGGGKRPYSQVTYSLPTGQAVFRAVTGTDAPGMARQIRDRIGDQRPAFINAFIMNWGLKLSDLKKMLEDLGSDYVAVTPTQLNALYKDSLKAK